MSAIHLVDGEKGGVGKSLMAMVLASYCRNAGIDCALIEADPGNPDVQRTHPQWAQQIHIGDSESGIYDADRIFETALE
jgi:MinD-like ATPase involved in chromosome partitioning or flagellar assembly